MELAISVILTTYNRASILPKSIKSVLIQTFTNFELIIVDDHSNDKTFDIVDSFQDSRIRYIRHDHNKGLAAGRNTGLQYARGKYIAYLDDDDEWLPEKLALQLQVIETSQYYPTLVYCGALREGSNKTVKTIPTEQGEMQDWIYEGYTMEESCMMVSREALLEIEGYSENLVSCIDHDIWMKMAEAGFYMKPVSQALVRVSDDSRNQMTSNLHKRLMGIAQFFQTWKPVVVKKRGFFAWKKIEKIYRMQISGQIKQQYLNQNINKQEALTYYKQFFQLQDKFSILENLLLCLNYILIKENFAKYTPIQFQKRKVLKQIYFILKSFLIISKPN
jgi:glycosyltransferase involved in cell wall biosynthesis